MSPPANDSRTVIGTPFHLTAVIPFESRYRRRSRGGQLAKRRIPTFRMSPNPISVAISDEPP